MAGFTAKMHQRVRAPEASWQLERAAVLSAPVEVPHGAEVVHERRRKDDEVPELVRRKDQVEAPRPDPLGKLVEVYHRAQAVERKHARDVQKRCDRHRLSEGAADDEVPTRKDGKEGICAVGHDADKFVARARPQSRVDAHNTRQQGQGDDEREVQGPQPSVAVKPVVDRREEGAANQDGNAWSGSPRINNAAYTAVARRASSPHRSSMPRACKTAAGTQDPSHIRTQRRVRALQAAR